MVLLITKALAFFSFCLASELGLYVYRADISTNLRTYVHND